jgi:hypothetical protein
MKQQAEGRGLVAKTNGSDALVFADRWLILAGDAVGGDPCFGRAACSGHDCSARAACSGDPGFGDRSLEAESAASFLRALGSIPPPDCTLEQLLSARLKTLLA